MLTREKINNRCSVQPEMTNENETITLLEVLNRMDLSHPIEDTWSTTTDPGSRTDNEDMSVINFDGDTDLRHELRWDITTDSETESESGNESFQVRRSGRKKKPIQRYGNNCFYYRFLLNNPIIFLLTFKV